jgi:hypothetical protein
MTTNPRYANGARRRALRAAILREQDTCWICGEEVDKTIATPHPLSPEVHEIIPIAYGGNPIDPTNCVLTHRVCNQCLGTGQHRGFCPVCTSTGSGTTDTRRGHHNPAPGVSYVTWRTW